MKNQWIKGFLFCLVCFALYPVTVRAGLHQKSKSSFPYPLFPLPALKPNVELVQVPFGYGQVITEIAPIYSSIEIAKTGKANQAARTLPIGQRKLTYISYLNEQTVDDRRYFEIENGQWMTGNDVHRVTPSPFQGLVFWRTPDNDFGWLLKNLKPSIEAGVSLESDPNIVELPQYRIVQIYEKQRIGDIDWFLIGKNQWVEDEMIARVMVNSTPPSGMNAKRWIEVNLMEQTLSVYDQYRLVFATLISSGQEGHWTRPGLFQITTKKETENMKLYDPTYVDNYLLEDVPWTMYFDQQRALHGAYWHNHFGIAGSRGCVNLSNGDSHWLFDWANPGDYVYVWDPSGKTPVDPTIYDAGGA